MIGGDRRLRRPRRASLVAMLGLRLLLVIGPTLALTAAAIAPRPAAACQPDPCASSNRFTSVELVGSIVAIDGVVRLSTRRQSNEAPMEDTLPFIDVQVTGPDGLPRAGTLEYQPLPQTIVWRPAEPFDALTIYDVAVTVDNDALALALDQEGIVEDSNCGENIAFAAELLTSETALPVLDPSAPASESSHELELVDSLSWMVCCDGAYPDSSVLSCIDSPTDVSWSEGHCATTRAYGQVRALQSFSDKDVPLHVANDLVLRLMQSDGSRSRFGTPGQLSVWLEDDEPFCASLRVHSLATGDSWAGPQHCYGDEWIDVLGYHQTDPSEQLAVCMGQPYTCENLESLEQWDPEACMPWGDPPGSDETGGDGSGGGDGTDGGGGTGDEGEEDGDGDGDGTDGGDTAPQDGDGHGDLGCGCRTQSDGWTPGPWLLMVGLWGWRRRCG